MIGRGISPFTILYNTDGNLYQLLVLHSQVDLSEVVPALVPRAVPERHRRGDVLEQQVSRDAPTTLRRRSLFVLLCTLPPRPVAASARLLWSWHARGQVITWAVLALLGLDGLVVHMHVVLHGSHVFVLQELL